MRPRLASAISTLAFLTACGGGTSSHAVTVVDSAGVTIVTNAAAQLDEAAEWALATEPSLTIETPDDGSFTLFQVRGLAPLSGGRLAVANGKPPEILVFGADGTLEARFGQEGDGPGEFRSIGSIAVLPGDSIAVFDWGNHRLSVFEPDGHLSQATDLSRTITDAGAAFADIHTLATGDLVLFTGGNFNSIRTPSDGPFRVESESMRIGLDGTVLASYGSFPGQEQFTHAAGTSAGNVLFGAWTDVASVGNDLVVGTEEMPELRLYGPDGALTRIIRWPDHDRTVTQERLDDFFDTLMIEGRVPEQQRALARATFAKLPHAQQEPPYRTVLGSGDGRLWVGDYQPWAGMPGMAAAARHWLVFSPDGTVTSTVDTPVGFVPKIVQGARVLGVFTDSIGVESIRAYDLQEM